MAARKISKDHNKTSRIRSKRSLASGRGQDIENLFRSWAPQLDAAAQRPLHRQISEKIASLLETGQLHAGDRLTSERRLTEILGVSRRTIRAAFSTLEDQRILSASHGRGNFLLDPPDRRLLRFLSLERFETKSWQPTPYHYQLIHQAEAEHNVSVHYRFTPSMEKLRETLSHPPEGYDGLLIVRPIQEWLDAITTMATPSPLPLLIVSRDLRSSRLNFVSPNHFEQTRKAVLRLAKWGHRRIGYISGHTSEKFMAIAQDGYLQGLAECNLPAPEEDVLLFSASSHLPLEDTIRSFLARRKFTAVVVAGSIFSIPFEKAVQTSGIVVPEQLSALLVTEPFTYDLLTLRWTAHIYPDKAVMARSLEVLSLIHRGQISTPVQEFIPHGSHKGVTCGFSPTPPAQLGGEWSLAQDPA